MDRVNGIEKDESEKRREGKKERESERERKKRRKKSGITATSDDGA